MVSFMILVSFGYQLWTSLDSESYIYQTYRVYSTWPQDQKHDPYFTPWARYHSHGIGILFGWIILNERKHGSIRNWLDKQKVWAKYLMITSAWMVSLGLMWFTVWGPNLCFRVNWKEHPNFWSINSRTFDNYTNLCLKSTVQSMNLHFRVALPVRMGESIGLPLQYGTHQYALFGALVLGC